MSVKYISNYYDLGTCSDAAVGIKHIFYFYYDIGPMTTHMQYYIAFWGTHVLQVLTVD